MQAWVWVTHDHRLLGHGDHRSPFTVLGDKYATAIKLGAQAEPFTLPGDGNKLFVNTKNGPRCGHEHTGRRCEDAPCCGCCD